MGLWISSKVSSCQYSITALILLLTKLRSGTTEREIWGLVLLWGLGIACNYGYKCLATACKMRLTGLTTWLLVFEIEGEFTILHPLNWNSHFNEIHGSLLENCWKCTIWAQSHSPAYNWLAIQFFASGEPHDMGLHGYTTPAWDMDLCLQDANCM